MMRIERFVLGSLGTNCYLLRNEETNEIVMIDPATCPDYFVKHIKSNGYIPKAILLTHGHFDHVMGIDQLVREFQIPVYLQEDEAEVLDNPSLNLSNMFGESFSYENVIGLKHGQILEVAGFQFEIIHTPGHTKGGCCYYEKMEEVLISGDTLFYRSMGRSDFPSGDGLLLVKSIREKLFVLPDEVMVYPGHGETTCIGDEKLFWGRSKT